MIVQHIARHFVLSSIAGLYHQWRGNRKGVLFFTLIKRHILHGDEVQAIPCIVTLGPPPHQKTTHIVIIETKPEFRTSWQNSIRVESMNSSTTLGRAPELAASHQGDLVDSLRGNLVALFRFRSLLDSRSQKTPQSLPLKICPELQFKRAARI